MTYSKRRPQNNPKVAIIIKKSSPPQPGHTVVQSLWMKIPDDRSSPNLQISSCCLLLASTLIYRVELKLSFRVVATRKTPKTIPVDNKLSSIQRLLDEPGRPSKLASKHPKKSDMRLCSSLTLFLLGSAALRTTAFVPVARQRAVSRPFSAPLRDAPLDTKESEKFLRQEIAERNSIVEQEELYYFLDGATLNADLKDEEATSTTRTTATTTTTPRDRKSLQTKLDRLTKTRPYPLFLAEKAVELVESTVGDLQKVFQSSSSAADEWTATTTMASKRERVLILGTGWGAAAFLKDIDTSLYDVTVISPRNYFLFTPMLAGASVGTVEYRSITQPVREVRDV
jgi:hypothetical protein